MSSSSAGEIRVGRPSPSRLPDDFKAQAEQVRSMDAERIRELLGCLSDQIMDSLDDALRLHLAL